MAQETFMSVEEKILIVTGNGSESSYAEILNQLLLAICPQVRTIQPITEDVYAPNFIDYDKTPNEKTIFFGKCKDSKRQSSAVEWKYEKYGIKYGWMGNVCVMTAIPKEVACEDYNSFQKYYNERLTAIKDEVRKLFPKAAPPPYIPYGFRIVDKKTRKPVELPAATSIADYVLGITRFFEYKPNARNHFGFVIPDPTTKCFDEKELERYQYELLVCEFALFGFKEYLSNCCAKMEDKNVFIVHAEKDIEYALLLRNLIQQKSKYCAALFTERVFNDNIHRMYGDVKVIFLGNTKTAKKRWTNDFFQYSYNKCGMRYAVVGSIAFVNTDGTDKSSSYEISQLYSDTLNKTFITPKKSSDYEKCQYEILTRLFVEKALDKLMEG